MHLTTITHVPTPLPPPQARLLAAKFPNSITRKHFLHESSWGAPNSQIYAFLRLLTVIILLNILHFLSQFIVDVIFSFSECIEKFVKGTSLFSQQYIQ